MVVSNLLAFMSSRPASMTNPQNRARGLLLYDDTAAKRGAQTEADGERMAEFSLVEIWRPRPEWHELTQLRRENSRPQRRPCCKLSSARGRSYWEFIGAGALSEGGWDVFAYWQMPNMDLVVELSERLEKVGWNRYFEQLNYVGKTITAEEYSASLLDGPEASR